MSKTKKKLLIVVLAVVGLLCAALGLSALLGGFNGGPNGGQNQTGPLGTGVAINHTWEHTGESSGDEHADAIALTANAGTLKVGATEEEATHYYLEDDLQLSTNLTIPSGYVELCLNGYMLKGTGSGSVITVNAGGHLALYDCPSETHTHKYTKGSDYFYTFADSGTELVGGIITGGNTKNGGAVYVDGGSFTMYDGILSGNKASNSGGAVYVQSSGEFVMEGGSIEGNIMTANTTIDGGAVMAKDSTFIMNAGTIKFNSSNENGGDTGAVGISGATAHFEMTNGSITDCMARAQGGVSIGYGASFTMRGGEIARCKSTTENYAGNVYILDGTFSMYGGEIHDGETPGSGAGVYNNASTFNMYGGKIYGNTATESGGGVYNIGTFTMYGGEILENETKTTIDSENYGGSGVYSSGTFTMNSGQISGNVGVANGAGVNVNSGTFTMNGGEISNNVNTVGRNGSGAGVHNNSTFIMNGGAIINNSQNGGNWGGVAIAMWSSGTIVIAGGEISGNTLINNAGYKGAIEFRTGTVTVGGTAQIYDNYTNSAECNLDPDTNTVTVGRLEKGAHIGITYKGSGTFTAGYKTNNGDTNPNNYFFMDDGHNVELSGNEVKAASTLASDTHVHHDPAYGEAVTYYPYEGTFEEGVAYFLTEDLTEGLTITGNVELCLNGHSVTAESGSVITVESGATLTLHDCHASGAITGGTGTQVGGTLCGGGIYLKSEATLNMDGGLVTGNTADRGAGIYLAEKAILSLGGSAKVTDNTASLGGGVYLTNKAEASLANAAAITDNSAQNGAGAYVHNAILELSSGEIARNTATENGGGVYNDNAIVIIAGGKINGNTAKNGGGVYMNNASLTMLGGAIDYNGASEKGAGVYLNGEFLLNGRTGEPEVYGNIAGAAQNNVYIPSGAKLDVVGTLSNTQTKKVGVTLEDGTGVFTHDLGVNGGSYTYFFADNIGYKTVDANGEAEIVESEGANDVPTLAPAGHAHITKFEAGTTVASGYYYLDADVSRTAVVTVAANTTVYLCLNGHALQFNANASSAVINVNGGTLYLMDCQEHTGTGTIKHVQGTGSAVNVLAGTFVMESGKLSNNTSAYGGGVDVSGTGTFIMNGGTITTNTATGTYGGGGVYVHSANAMFIMNGGTIKDNNSTADDGGGVYHNSGTFNMYGGTISGNTSKDDGGGVYHNSGTFNMYGGTISGNTGNNAGNNKNGGGGVANIGTFNMYGGTISGNKAVGTYGGGVFIFRDATFNFYGGEISGNTANGGGGVYNGGTFNMGGLEGYTPVIDGNTSTGDGGGVRANGGTFTMENGAISNNTAKGGDADGGGIMVNNGTCTMNGGTISGNTAVDGGGGVFIYNNSTFTMYGGKICNNMGRGSASTGGGGGVASDSGSGSSGTPKFNMYGGEISGNTSKGRGGGVLRIYGTFNLGGNANKTPAIYGNTVNGVETNVYLRSGQTITINGPLGEGEGKIGVTMEAGAGTFTSGLGGRGSEKYFFSDRDGYIVENVNPAGGGEAKLTATNPHAHGELEFKGTISAGTTELADETNYYLTGNVTLNRSLTVPAGHVVHLCLNGFTLTGANNQNVITVDGGKLILCTCGYNGTLKHQGSGRGVEVTNSGEFVLESGILTGSGSASAVYVSSGTFTMKGGVIQNNSGATDGTVHLGGENATMNMLGGVITGNSATQNGGGVYVASGAKLNIGGGEIISNTVNSAENNVYLEKGATVKVTDNLVGTTMIGITLAEEEDALPYVFTQGLKDNGGNYGYFVADGAGYAVSAVEESEFAGEAQVEISDHAHIIPLTANGEITKGGHYFLDRDVYLANGTVTIPSGVTVYLCLNGHALQFNANASSAVIDVNGGTLYLMDCQEHTGTGTIKHAQGTGSAVNVLAGTFVMESGKLSNNTSAYGGGVDVSGTGTFIMNGGTITTNTATGAYGGGGVYVHSANATFIMNGGTIKDNNSTADDGGGVYNTGTFNMYGGTISGNTSKDDGGGVYHNSGTFNMYGGTISGNTGNNAGANKNGGGGVANAATFNMYGGKISDNTAAKAAGGAVYVYANGNFNFYGGEISGNTAAINGGGVHNLGTFNLGGEIPSNVTLPEGFVKTAPVISGNILTNGTVNNVYLMTNKTIAVNGELPEGTLIGINMQTNGVFTTGITSAEDAETYRHYFYADNKDQCIGVSGTNLNIGNHVKTGVNELSPVKDPNNHYYNDCENCVGPMRAEAHIWSEWKFDRELGVMARECTVCHYVQTADTEGYAFSGLVYAADTEYFVGETFRFHEIAVIYANDNGDYEMIELEKSDYTITYQNPSANSFEYEDTYVTLSYTVAGKTYEKVIGVEVSGILKDLKADFHYTYEDPDYPEFKNLVDKDVTLDDLHNRVHLTVTAYFDDGNGGLIDKEIDNYTLSGELIVGETNTVKVTFLDKEDTFKVTVHDLNAEAREMTSAKIDDVLAAAKARIDARSSMTSAKKAEVKAALEAAANEIRETLETDEDRSGFGEYVGAAQDALDEIVRLELLRQDKVDEIKEELAAVKGKYADRTDLSAAQKALIDSKLEAIANGYIEQLDEADEDDFTSIVEEAIEELNKKVLVEIAREEKKNEIDAAAATAKGEIDKARMTDAQKEAAKKAIDEVAKNTKDDLEAEPEEGNFEGYLDEFAAGIEEILEDAKARTNTKNEMDKIADEFKDKVNGTDLTDERKEAVKKRVDDLTKDAWGYVDDEPDRNEFPRLVEEFEERLQLLLDDPLLEEKADFWNDLEEHAKAKKEYVDSREDLPPEEKERRKNAIDEEVVKGNEAIRNAESVEEAQKELDDAKLIISRIADENYDKKEEAKDEIDQAAQDKKDEIDGRDDLFPEEKEEAKKAVDEEAQKAKDNIDKAITPEGVQKALDDGLAAIERAGTPAKPHEIGGMIVIIAIETLTILGLGTAGVIIKKKKGL